MGFGAIPSPVSIIPGDMFQRSNLRGVPSFEDLYKISSTEEGLKLGGNLLMEKRKIRNLIIIPKEMIHLLRSRDEWSAIYLLLSTATKMKGKLVGVE